jgi:hypothetical protein
MCSSVKTEQYFDLMNFSFECMPLAYCWLLKCCSRSWSVWPPLRIPTFLFSDLHRQKSGGVKSGDRFGQRSFEITRSSKHLYVRFQVLTAANMMFRGFWDVLPCSQKSTDVSEVHAASIIRAMMMEAARTS